MLSIALKKMSTHCLLVRNSPKNSKKKHALSFETAINAKVATIREELETKYAEKFAEEVASAKESLAERVDSYLEYVADEWMSENQLAVEAWSQD